MDCEEKCNLLANEIRNILGRGITLNSDVVHFIDSTFSNPTIEALQAILEDDSNCEKDSLIELLFFPDEIMQLGLEDLLERLQLNPSDEIRVLALICRKPLQVSFRLPEDRGSFNLPLSSDVAPGLLNRLHASKHLAPDLRLAIDRHAGENDRNVYKVKLRNARFEQHDSKIRFLCELFQKVKPERHDFGGCLDFSLSLLNEMTDDSDMYQALMAKKRFYLRSLQRAQKMDMQLQKSNLETLLSQGKRIILVDKADARKKLLIIDRISRAVFGKTEYYDDLDQDGNPFEISSDQDIQDIIKRFLP
jgi:hypothetical protein